MPIGYEFPWSSEERKRRYEEKKEEYLARQEAASGESDADIWLSTGRWAAGVAPGTGVEVMPGDIGIEPGMLPGFQPKEIEELPEGSVPGEVYPWLTEVGAEKEVNAWYSNPWLWGGVAAAGGLTLFLATRK